MTKPHKDESLSDSMETILPYFSKLYFFNKLHHVRERTVRKAQGRRPGLQAEDKLLLGPEEFSLLWLIDTLADKELETMNGVKCCEKTVLHQAYIWRKDPSTDKELKKANNRFDSIIRKLLATELIDYEDDKDPRKHVYYVLRDGNSLLDSLREERVGQLSRIFSLGTIKSEEYSRIEKEFKKIAEAAWKILRDEAKSVNLKSA